MDFILKCQKIEYGFLIVFLSEKMLFHLFLPEK